MRDLTRLSHVLVAGPDLPTPDRTVQPTRLLAIVIVVIFTLLHQIAQADNCGPATGGSPSSCPGVASPGTDKPDAAAGNPINVMTGNKYEREVDLPPLPGVLGLEIMRHYNSESSRIGRQNGAMGRGWRLSYETELYDAFGRIQVVTGDGARVTFSRDQKNISLCSSPNPANGTIAIIKKSDRLNEYVWTWTNGRKLYFDTSGKLYRILAPTGEAVTLTYDRNNLLRRVTDPQGRSLEFVYFDPAMPNHFHGVQFIDSPVGRFEYQYGSELPKGAGQFDARQLKALLVKVKLPATVASDQPTQAAIAKTTTSQAARIYHHEDPRSPWVLTGISVEAVAPGGKLIATRYSTYGYDADARAILSTHADNVNKVTLDLSEAGKTVLTNSLGQKTSYLYAIIAGEHRLLEVRGAGCALCGEPNVRYGYNSVGQLTDTIKLSPAGVPVAAIRTEFDKLGRTVRVGRIGYTRGKAQPVEWSTRFGYAGSAFSPTLIARPSVVPGKEAIQRITYNAARQPLTVTDVGWIPTFDGTTAAGRIERTTSYKYVTINDQSRLIEIDGPLPNGKTNSPLDSDITIIEYDNRSNNWVPPTPKLDKAGLEKYAPTLRREGLFTRIVAPGNFITEVLARDQAKRPTKLRSIDGDLVQVITMAGDWRGAPHDIDVVAGALRRHLHYDYNSAGQLAAITLPGGLRTELLYNAAGQLSRTMLPDGSGVLNLEDTEGHTVRSKRFLDAAHSGSALPDLNFQYDHPERAPSKLMRVGDTLGVLRNYRYDDIGQAVAVTNALGIATTFAYDPLGGLASRTDAAGSPESATTGWDYDSAGRMTKMTAANAVATVRRYDDFGRKVIEADPDHGVTLYSYDAADHLIARIDETMAVTRFTFDHANRLMAMGTDQRPNLLQYHYTGRQLAGMTSTTDEDPRHATERIDYQRDALGRIVKESRWLANIDQGTAERTSPGTPPGIVFVTTTVYDDAGRLVGQTLPDGHELKYRYAPSGDGGTPRAMHRPGQLEAILFDGAAVVTDIDQSIAGGLKGYTMSNGMRQRIGLDRRGRIAHLQVLADGAEGTSNWWQRINAWFGASAPAITAAYRQDNRYDDAGRLVQIDHKTAAVQPGTTPAERRDGYAYDRLDRLASIVGSNGADATYRYDTGGNRVAEVSARSDAPGNGQIKSSYLYAQASNRLLAVTYDESAQRAASRPPGTAPESQAQIAHTMRSAWFYHATGVQLAQMQWLNRGGASNRRIVYNVAKRPIAVYDNDQLIASYHYNSRGERIAKTVYPMRPALRTVANSLEVQKGETTYSLYRDQRLAFEADGAGHVTAHHIYLNGKPVAKIEMEADNSATHRLWRAVAARGEKNTYATVARIYAIVTDHLGTPQQVFDESRKVVWLAETTSFGQARIAFSALTGTGANTRRFTMNLRLPGQVFDDETRLNYNYLRDYDPALGRYTTPDPAGLVGGSNPYVYVSNNPLTNVDPLGLYQSDIHYYMTFFLAVAAGVNPDEARTIALATQYIDDNRDTSPLNVSLTTGLTDEHRARLLTYHFTMVPSTINPGSGMVSGMTSGLLQYGTPPSSPNYTNITENAQLQYLSAAVTIAGKETNLANSRCTQLQFFGEYLHAFEDTFSHRDADDMPIALNNGLGHGVYGSNPDYTYNHSDLLRWDTNFARTLEAEREVFAKMAAWGDPAKAKTFSEISKTLTDFNAIHEIEADGDTTEQRQKGYQRKIAVLQATLKKFYPGIDITQSGAKSFSTSDATTNRKANLHDKSGNILDQKLYRGTILPK